VCEWLPRVVAAPTPLVFSGMNVKPRSVELATWPSGFLDRSSGSAIDGKKVRNWNLGSDWRGIGGCSGFLGKLLTDLEHSFVAVGAEADKHGEVDFDALLAEFALAEGLRCLHGESGFDSSGSGRIHDLAACLVIEKPGLGLVHGATVHDRDG